MKGKEAISRMIPRFLVCITECTGSSQDLKHKKTRFEENGFVIGQLYLKSF